MTFNLKTWLAVPIVVGMIVVSNAAGAQERPIKRDQLVQMFDSMRAEAPWNVDGPLLWGYFFYSRDRAKLRSAADDLAREGYRIVSLEPVESGSSRPWRLHVERIETHTVDSLLARNEQFYRLAERYRLDSYDGMDVGPAP